MSAAIKRSVDVVLSAAALAGLSPLLTVIGALIKLEDGGPPLFTQERAGRHARPFTIYKFRSMIQNADDYLDVDGRPTRDRVTRVGRVLRKTGMDELPQILNVLRGEMSIVGPRPLPMEYAARMDEIQRRRFDVRPGMTGLAQVSGRNNLTLTERIRYDVDYVDNYSLGLDLWILLRTLGAILGRDAILDRRVENVDL